MDPSTQTAPIAAEKLLAEFEELSRRNATERDPELERRILKLRHRAGVATVREAQGSPAMPFPEPAFDRLPERNGSDLPEFTPADLDAELLRAAILRDGCMRIRGLFDRDRALRFAEEIDLSFAERESADSVDRASTGLYEAFTLDENNAGLEGIRPWIRAGGGVLAADSPKLAFDMFDAFEQAGLRQTIAAYLGERPAVSVHKCTLRKAEPSVPGGWHQDGAFMGDVRSLNVWVSLSRCGDEAPGLDLVPQRLDDLVPTGGDEVEFANQVSQANAEKAAGDMGITRPIFEAGDGLLFDDLFLHRTGSDPTMPKPRYAIESWFFAPSSFPEDYAPLAF